MWARLGIWYVWSPITLSGSSTNYYDLSEHVWTLHKKSSYIPVEWLAQLPISHMAIPACYLTLMVPIQGNINIKTDYLKKCCKETYSSKSYLYHLLKPIEILMSLTEVLLFYTWVNCDFTQKQKVTKNGWRVVLVMMAIQFIWSILIGGRGNNFVLSHFPLTRYKFNRGEGRMYFVAIYLPIVVTFLGILIVICC